MSDVDMSLQQRIFLYGAFFISTVMIIAGLLFYMTISDAIEEQVGKRALNIALTSSERPDIQAGFSYCFAVLYGIVQGILEIKRSLYCLRPRYPN